MELIKVLIKEVEDSFVTSLRVDDRWETCEYNSNGKEVYWYGKDVEAVYYTGFYSNGEESFIIENRTKITFYDKKGVEITEQEWLEINPQYKQTPSTNLKALLKYGRVVEFDYFGEGEEFRMGVVQWGEYEIKTACGTHDINRMDNKLVDVSNTKIIRIYENTINGLDLIWDRKRDYIEPIDWTKVEVDTKILVRYMDDADWKKRHFAKYECGQVFAWEDGATSFTTKCTTKWNEAKLYDGE